MVGRKVGEIRLENLFFNARKVYLECCAVRGGGDSLEPAELLRPARGRVVSFRLKVHASWKLPCCHLLEMALVTLRCCQEDSHPQGRGVERPHPRNPAHRQHHGGVARGRWPWHGQGEHSWEKVRPHMGVAETLCLRRASIRPRSRVTPPRREATRPIGV